MERFDSVVAALVDYPNVTPPAVSKREFGSNALKVRGRIFAMLVNGQLVVKLPSARVTALIASGDGLPFDGGKGRPMKEWVALEPTSRQDWVAVAKDAMGFVLAASK